MGYRLGADIGGTFTDVQLLDDVTGELYVGKVPTTKEDPSKGFLQGVKRVTEERGIEVGDVASIVHGTTVVTNSLLERTFSPAGLVVTKGYRGLLEYARCHIPGPFGTWLIHVPERRPVLLEDVAEAPERLTHRGEVHVELDEDAIRQIAEDYREKGIASVGVSLLWSFVDAKHELRIKELFEEVYPDCEVILSSDVLAEIQEYERAATTALSAALKPQVAEYLASIETALNGSSSGSSLYCMKSSGGAVTARRARERPIELALSGPAGGVLGMRDICEELGYSQAITFDMGGTSTDISFIDGMEPALATDGIINGYPIRVPMIDIHTIGAGGGSIAWLSAGDRPRVGPQSAGASPGPAAYDRGGTDATVTDANIVLGRFPTELLDGEMQLNKERAETAVAEWGSQLGLDPVPAALTIVELAINEMNLAIQEVSTRKGRDPRECVLVAFGGAGPAHAARLADLLEIPTVLAPSSPGVASTTGLIAAEVRSDFVHSVIAGVTDKDDFAVAKETFSSLKERAWQALADEGVDEEDRVLQLTADMRYLSQQYAVNAVIRARSGDWKSDLDQEEVLKAVEQFHGNHARLCGFDYREQGAGGVQLVNLRVAAIGKSTRMGRTRADDEGSDPSGALKGNRSVCFDESGEFVDTSIYSRAELRPGNVVAGPAVIEEFDSTTVVWPGQTARIDGFLNIVIDTGRTNGSR
ncbi:MAG: N-methylhydantoinase [Thermoleophilaceae bacterium]|jgi:N-methylhydantoinase A|nr:N-methylhydantoinase [Thermoleophilaceae bacterium]